MVSKSREQKFEKLYVGATFGKGIDHDKYGTIALLLLCFTLFGWYRAYVAWCFEHEKAMLPAVVEPIRTTIYINSSPKAELSLLPGIGPKLAQAIIDYRNQVGRIESWQEFDKIRGIGPKLIEQVRPYASLQ
jgi:competence ComEA-like helix-hairpin-helix protein